MDSSIIFFFLAVLIIGAILLIIIVLTKKYISPLNIEKFRVNWLKIEKQLNINEPSSFQLTIINADKLLDQALRDSAYKGDTMAERMKSAKDVWSKRDELWRAHKLRNEIAHESNVIVSYQEARIAISSFKQALKDLGAI